MGRFSLSEQLDTLSSIGKCLDGDLIRTPFEQPVEEERRGDVDQYDDNLNFPGNENLCEAMENITDYKKRDII